MIVLRPSNDQIGRLVSKQEIKENTEYRLSRHTLETEYDEGRLLYNTLTGKLVFLNKNDIDLSDREVLITDRFLVPKAFDEIQYVEALRKLFIYSQRHSEAIDHFTVLTTTDCNARCFYCYEKGTRRFSMTEQTAKDVVDYIVRKNGNKPIKISWFGGEPLMNMQAIDTISNGLTRRGVDFKSIMTSNGFYLIPEISDKAKKVWHADTIQITIDGTKEVYNRTKAYVNDCPDPFDRILNNIEAALDAGLTISARMNMDADNADDLFDLADILAARFSGRQNFFAHIQLLREVSGKIHHFDTVEQLEKVYWGLADKLKKLKISRDIPLSHKLRINSCMADSTNSIVILPDGRTAKCEHVNENEIAGSIYNDSVDDNKICEWKERVQFPECKECPMYPLCICLKKCDWSKNGCMVQTRNNWIERTKRQMITVYQEYKNKQKEA